MEKETPSVAVEAQQVVGQAVDQARQQGMSQLASQKDRIAGTLGNVANALHSTSQQLKQSDDIPIGDYVDQMASSVEQFSSHIRDRNVDELIGEAESMARRQPWLFLGGAFLVGLVAARFLKSSRPEPISSTSYSPSYPRMARPNPTTGSMSWQISGVRSPASGSSYLPTSPATPGSAYPAASPVTPRSSYPSTSPTTKPEGSATSETNWRG